MDQKEMEWEKTAAILKEKIAEGSVPFAPGAIDGIYIYHTVHKPGPAEGLIEAIQILHAEGEDEAQSRIQKVFMKPQETRMISMIDELQHYIIDHVNEFSPEKLLKLASQLIASPNTEMVKMGLSLMELVNFSESEDFRGVVVSMASDEEFTLFGLYVIRAWKDSPYIIYSLAKRLTGWGRIHAVKYLKPATPEMKAWLLLEGWKNDILPAYSALEAAVKGELTAYLEKDSLEEDEASSIEGLVAALMDEGPVAGISAFPEKEKLASLLEKHRKNGAFSELMDKMLSAMKENRA